MSKKLSKILDECIARMRNGETIDDVLAGYPDVREYIEPLLRIAQKVAEVPSVSPSPAFLDSSGMRLMRLIHQPAVRPGKVVAGTSGLAGRIKNVLAGFSSTRRIAATVSIALAVILLAVTGQYLFSMPSPVTAATGLLSILSGEVRIESIGSGESLSVADGMKLESGTRVVTGNASHVLITFFDGSTIKLSPGTSLDIEKLEQDEDQSTVILLKQWLGRTWSRVVKMTDMESRYEIETPSATAIVRGTLFATEVDETGNTTVSTTEGLVSVAAEGKEVLVPAEKKTAVEKGKSPSEPEAVSEPETDITIIINGAVAGTISDPSGAGTGVMPSGQSFNQIQDSLSAFPSGDTQVIRLKNPADGKYTLTLRYLAGTTANYTIRCRSHGVITGEYLGTLAAEGDSGYQIQFKLKGGEQAAITDVDVKPLAEKKSEKADSGEKSLKEIPPGQEKQEDIEKAVPAGQDKKDDTSSTIPPGQEKKADAEKSLSPGKTEKPETANATNAGQEKKPDAGDTVSPGQMKKDDTGNSSPPGQEQADNDSKVPAGEENQDDEGAMPPGQNNDDEKSTPPGQTDKGVGTDNSTNEQPGKNKRN